MKGPIDVAQDPAQAILKRFVHPAAGQKGQLSLRPRIC
jgi:hypothetical protein